MQSIVKRMGGGRSREVRSTWRTPLLASLLMAALAARSSSGAWYSTDTSPSTDRSPVEATRAFIATLRNEQKAAAMYEFADPVRSNWSSLPVGMTDFDLNGVRVGDLDDEQTVALVDFLSVALSHHGYALIAGIVGAERQLSASIRAPLVGWSPENYWIAFFGQPSGDHVWGWQFGGHHLALNVTVADGRSYMSPTFLGVAPSSYTEDGPAIAPLDSHVRAGLSLFNSLDQDTQELAFVDNRPEVSTGAGQDGLIPAPEGAPVSAWSDTQQQSLLDTIALWVGMVDPASSQARLAEIRAGLHDTYFAWNGGPDSQGPVYYRIQGPTLIIELASQAPISQGGHYHSLYRDLTNG
ncbi:MAG: DUF3500 domain-containing protein [Acidimicrobiia bacterium]|nr:DUF3500 domain-containing protein [Acidimicrobiia bacterium]